MQQLLGIAHVFSRVAGARAGALDRPGFHLALADADEALGRKAQQGAAVGQLLVAGEGGGAGFAQGLVSVPRVALAGRAEALGKVDLVAVAGLDVALHLVKGGLVLLGLQVAGHRRE
ncbi:hypothetical protein D3C79_767190 [compost metagenome]